MLNGKEVKLYEISFTKDGKRNTKQFMSNSPKQARKDCVKLNGVNKSSILSTYLVTKVKV